MPVNASETGINAPKELEIFRHTWLEELRKTARNVQTHEDQRPSSVAGSVVPPSALSEYCAPSARITTPSVGGPTSNKGQMSTARLSQLGPFMFDDPIDDMDDSRTFHIRVDFGTTFSSVSYCIYSTSEERPRVFAHEIQSITHWPNAAMQESTQVPSEVWYSVVPKDRKPNELAGIKDDEGRNSTQSPCVKSQGDSFDCSFSNYLDDEEMDDGESSDFVWGYTVAHLLYCINTTRNRQTLVRYSKLWLLNSRQSDHTQPERDILGPILDRMIRRKIISKYRRRGVPDIRDIQDPITDYLVQILQHTKERLTLLHNYSSECTVKFALTIPTIWSAEASRVLQVCMQTAARAASFGCLEDGSMSDLFIISEPEAAATFLMAQSHSILTGDTFIVLDCGGGTVDAVTYSASQDHPLRVGREEVPPGGGNYGASHANVNFHKLVTDRLRGETYLFRNGQTLESVVNPLMQQFEASWKRRVNLEERCGHRIPIPGLLSDQRQGLTGDNLKRFEDNYMFMQRRDYKLIFQPLLDGVESVLAEQLLLSSAKGKFVKKVFLVGGFGDSPALRSHLKKYLAAHSKSLPYDVTMVTYDRGSGAIVSSGSVLRALDQENGPYRIARSSYGFLRTEPYDRSLPGHAAATPWVDDVDGGKYVKTILWFIVKGQLISAREHFPPLIAYHTFDATIQKFLCEELLYVSDTATESHYTRAHPKNGDAQVEGRIVADMTRFRDTEGVQPISPEPGTIGRRHYKILYELSAIVNGMNLRWEAKYPAGAEGEVMEACQVSIAAAFQPGTG